MCSQTTLSTTSSNEQWQIRYDHNLMTEYLMTLVINKNSMVIKLSVAV